MSKKSRKGLPWTDEEDATIRRLSGKMTWNEIARLLRRPRPATYYRAAQLKETGHGHTDASNEGSGSCRIYPVWVEGVGKFSCVRDAADEMGVTASTIRGALSQGTAVRGYRVSRDGVFRGKKPRSAGTWIAEGDDGSRIRAWSAAVLADRLGMSRSAVSAAFRRGHLCKGRRIICIPQTVSPPEDEEGDDE